MRFASDKLVYVDFNDIIFENLYIGKDDKSKQQLFIIIDCSCDLEAAVSEIERSYPRSLC